MQQRSSYKRLPVLFLHMQSLFLFVKHENTKTESIYRPQCSLNVLHLTCSDLCSLVVSGGSGPSRSCGQRRTEWIQSESLPTQLGNMCDGVCDIDQRNDRIRQYFASFKGVCKSAVLTSSLRERPLLKS